MKKLISKKQLILYGCSGLGINMLSLFMGSYLCSALQVGGFIDNREYWTYLDKDIVVYALCLHPSLPSTPMTAPVAAHERYIQLRSLSLSCGE